MPANRWGQHRVSMAFVAASVDVSGFEVVGRDGSIGMVDEASNDVRVSYIIVDTWEWLSGRLVILPAATVERIDAAARRVIIDQSMAEIRRAPEFYPEDLRSASYEDALTGYYHGIYSTGL